MTKGDVLTFGETMLRLTPPGKQRLAQAATLDIWVAGSESNVAAALCALGCSATWVSRLPDNAMGRKVESSLKAQGVDVSHIVWSAASDRLGIFYAEPETAPRAGMVIYDRADSAASKLCPADLPDSLFDSHRHLHVTGITPALSVSCAETVTDAIRRARQRKMTVSFDVNYRAKLWSPEAAAESLSALMTHSDILFCSRGDAERLFKLSGTDEEVARQLREKFEADIAAVTCGGDGAVACDAAGCVTAPAIPIESSVERFGSGDALAAGFLAEYLAGSDLNTCLRFGVASAALKRTIPGDLLFATRSDVEAIEGDSAGWR